MNEINFDEYNYKKNCSGNYKTCKNFECVICGERDCPFGEPLHYHHDGCPVCSCIIRRDIKNGKIL